MIRQPKSLRELIQSKNRETRIIAEALGIHISNSQGYLSGAVKIPLRHAETIAFLLGVSVQVVLDASAESCARSIQRRLDRDQ